LRPARWASLEAPVSILIVASLALVAGPLVGTVGRASRALREAVDGFALVVTAGLCFVAVLPHVAGEIGPAGLALMTVGSLLPILAHRLRFRRIGSVGLVVGALIAGLVPLLLTPTRTASLGHGSRLTQSLRGIAFGLPLPVCSCGVLPLYESLVRRAAPPVAAMAFFVATPELGLDAVLLSVPLLGASLTVARVVAAFAVALVVAVLVSGRPCASVAVDGDPSPPAPHDPLLDRIRAGFRFGFVQVFDHTMPWIALGLVIAALAEPMLSHGAIASIPSMLQVPLAALVGVPVYVCASGATPVAALALHKGLSAGAAIAFLIAGPRPTSRPSAYWLGCTDAGRPSSSESRSRSSRSWRVGQSMDSASLPRRSSMRAPSPTWVGRGSLGSARPASPR